MSLVELWLLAFLATVVIETPVVVWLTRDLLERRSALGLALGLQCLTHPALWFGVPRFQPHWLWVACAELGVVLVEAIALGLFLRRAGAAREVAIRRGAAVSLFANSVSALIGLALQ